MFTTPSSPAPPAAAATTSAGTAALAHVPVPTIPLSAVADTLKVPVGLSLHGSSSEPNLTENPKVIRKRKRCYSEVLNDFMDEMRKMFLDFKGEQEKRSDQICSAVEVIRSSVDFLAEKQDALRTRVEQLEVGRKADAQHIKSLEDRLDGLERNSRSTCLEIRNIPAPTSESKTVLLETFINTSKALNVPVDHREVKDIFRINNKDPAHRTIIVELTSALLKEKMIAMYRKFNKGSSKLTTEHIHLSGPPKQIFISENLSPKMKRLFYLAREFAKSNDFMFCWVSHGKIFLRRRENGPLFRVVNETDLGKIIDPK
ncbi:Zinc finger DNA binding protein [Operophtera brumata]|uniref:Zinc finger DNA binding protein n=1 Tax=Operophtera brumata TaxID=104452 RepID=A0A0L7LLD5_OPEBR|nr:Zinc finger DNA binding protein [Operophtera brumata]